MELARQRLMFPEGSGYRSETGGLMEALRVLDVQTIREYSTFNKPNKVTMQTTMSRKICLLLLLGMSIMVRFYRLCRIKSNHRYSPRANLNYRFGKGNPCRVC